MKTKENIAKAVVFVILCLLSVFWIYPVFMIFINSLKGDTFISTNTVFALPNAKSFVGLSNYVDVLSSKSVTVWYNIITKDRAIKENGIQSCILILIIINENSLNSNLNNE